MDKDNKYVFMSWDCPESREYFPYLLAVQIWQRRQAGLPHMELSASGEEAIIFIGEIVAHHRRAIEWLQIH